MIKGIWTMIEPYCGNGHEEDVKLDITEGPFSLFYSCPKYHEANRDEGERACANRINLIDYEKMINYITNLILEGSSSGTFVNLKNYKWKKNGIEYEIFEHTDSKIKIKIKSSKALR